MTYHPLWAQHLHKNGGESIPAKRARQAKAAFVAFLIQAQSISRKCTFSRPYLFSSSSGSPQHNQHITIPPEVSIFFCGKSPFLPIIRFLPVLFIYHPILKIPRPGAIIKVQRGDTNVQLTFFRHSFPKKSSYA